MWDAGTDTARGGSSTVWWSDQGGHEGWGRGAMDQLITRARGGVVYVERGGWDLEIAMREREQGSTSE